MVSHFGEVIFPSSRAFWDDEEEYELTDNLEYRSKLSFRWLKSKPENIQKFILIEGDLLIRNIIFYIISDAFAEQCLCYEVEEACIVEDEDRRKISVIHQIDEKTYLCTILPCFNIKVAGTFITEISDLLLNTVSIISIVCRHVSEFQSADIPNGPSFLRMLTTKHTTVPESKVKKLEQPNIVYGVSAGVLSYAELKGMSAKLYILYMDSFVVDSKCIEPILEILRNETTCKLQNVTFAGSFFSKGNLYM